MFLGEVLNIRESLTTEFKEFCLKKSIYDYYTSEEIHRIIESGILDTDFNQVVYETLQKYFIYYIPKYASGYSNCDNSGILHIGINDFGEVTGIPCIGTLDTALVHAYLDDVIKNYLQGVNVSTSTYTDNISISIEKLDVDMSLLYDNTTELMNEMKANNKIYKELYKKYLNDRFTWLKTLFTYTCKLTFLMKDKNHEICSYIETHCTNDVITAKAVASTQSARGTIIDFNVIIEYKDTPCHYIYWLLRFKDDIISNHLAQRPRPPVLPRTSNVAFALLTQMSNLRHLFLSKNKDIQYYVIKVHLPSNIRKGSYLQYKHPYKNKWDAKIRVVHKALGPCLLSI